MRSKTRPAGARLVGIRYILSFISPARLHEPANRRRFGDFLASGNNLLSHTRFSDSVGMGRFNKRILDETPVKSRFSRTFQRMFAW